MLCIWEWLPKPGVWHFKIFIRSYISGHLQSRLSLDLNFDALISLSSPSFSFDLTPAPPSRNQSTESAPNLSRSSKSVLLFSDISRNISKSEWSINLQIIVHSKFSNYRWESLHGPKWLTLWIFLFPRTGFYEFYLYFGVCSDSLEERTVVDIFENLRLSPSVSSNKLYSY